MHFMFYPKDFVEKVLPTGMLSEVPANLIGLGLSKAQAHRR